MISTGMTSSWEEGAGFRTRLQRGNCLKRGEEQIKWLINHVHEVRWLQLKFFGRVDENESLLAVTSHLALLDNISMCTPNKMEVI